MLNGTYKAPLRYIYASLKMLIDVFLPCVIRNFLLFFGKKVALVFIFEYARRSGTARYNELPLSARQRVVSAWDVSALSRFGQFIMPFRPN